MNYGNRPFVIAQRNAHTYGYLCMFLQFCIHTEGYEVLDRFLPKALLPKDYGGDEATSEKLNGNSTSKTIYAIFQYIK